MKHVHFVGIGGTGLSAIARLLMESDYLVSGSDRVLTPLAEQLKLAGAQVFLGHDPQNIAGADIVVRSSAVPDDNIEVQAALAAGIPVTKRAQFLGQILADRRMIAVAGTHGKTTTSSMIAWMLTVVGSDPSYILGGVSQNLGTNAHAGGGEDFVIEADEYDRMFLGLRPDIAVITNIEHDHPDCFPTPQEFQQAFVDFACLLRPGGALLVCGDDPGALQLAQNERLSDCSIYTYGLGNPLSQNPFDYQARDILLEKPGNYSYAAFHRGSFLSRVSLGVPGKHNVQNSLAALSVAHLLNLPLVEVSVALGKFRGTGRRFEVRGEVNGVVVIDDYAHHPTEIRSTLAAARSRYGDRELWVVWQPHTYSRTRLLFDEFAKAFGNTDHVVVTEVYPAREPIQPDFSARRVVDAMPHPDVHFVPDLAEVTTFLLARLQPGAVLLVLSAGDADQISAQVLAALPEKEEDYV
jgi:UDP-N-acetylmuramate--alanine ligase